MKIRIFPNLEICNTYFQIWLILFKLCLLCQNASKGEYKSVESRNHPKTFAGNGRSNTAFTVCQRNGNSAFDAQPRVQRNGCFKFGTSGKDSSPFRHFRGVAVGFGVGKIHFDSGLFVQESDGFGRKRHDHSYGNRKTFD